MPRESQYSIVLSPSEIEELQRWPAKYTPPYFKAVWATLILLAAEGLSNAAIAQCLLTRRVVVSLWRKRFYEQRLPVLDERPRLGHDDGHGVKRNHSKWPGPCAT